MSYTYEYPMYAYTADLVAFDITTMYYPRVLLIKRKNAPFAGYWALPGGHVDPNESAIQAAVREFKEEAASKFNLRPVGTLDFVGVFDKPGRDPRGNYISSAFWTIINSEDAKKLFSNESQKENDEEVSEVKWFSITELPLLAFDHHSIISTACVKLGLYLSYKK